MPIGQLAYLILVIVAFSVFGVVLFAAYLANALAEPRQRNTKTVVAMKRAPKTGAPAAPARAPQSGPRSKSAA